MSWIRPLVVVALAGTCVVVLSPADAVFPGENGAIVFIGGSRDLFTVNPDGSHARRLTNADRPLRDPRFNATGSRIAYARLGRQSFDIWVMRADGSHKRRIVSGPARQEQPAWSPDGSQLAYLSDESGQRQIHLYDFATRTSSQLTSAAYGAWDPAWSPDGSRLAFIAATPTGLDPNEVDPCCYAKYWRLVMTVRPDGTHLQEATHDLFASDPSFAPGGHRLVFAIKGFAYRDYCPGWISTVRLDGTSMRRVSPSDTCNNITPTWSPDGRWVAWFASEFEGASAGIYRVRLGTDGANLIHRAPWSGATIDWARR